MKRALQPVPAPQAADEDEILARAFLLADRGDPRAGLALAQEALAAARTRNDAPRVVRALGIVANAYRALADYSAAAKAALEGIETAERAGLAAQAGPAHIDLALVFFDLGDYPKALAQLAEARRGLESSPDTSLESRCAHAEGLVQSRLAEFELARASFHRALKLRTQAGDDAATAATLNSLGVMHLRLAQAPSVAPEVARDEFRQALDHFHETRRLALRERDERLVLLAEINIAGALGGLGRYDEALARFLAQLRAARALGDRHNESLILANAGEAARRAGQLERARELGEEALSVAQATASKVREREARLQLSLTCEAAADYASALDHYKVHHALERETQAAEARRVAHALALRGEIEQAQREAAKLRSANRVLEREARQDALTGLANRRAFDDALRTELGRARRIGATVAVVAFDLDHFKSINDRYSHAAGDMVLREAAKVLRAHCRASDLAARIGGEEFALLLPGADYDAACAVAERVRDELASRDLSAIAPAVKVTLSAGVAVERGTGDPADLLREADAALYRAKAQGRDRVCR